jgi:hypothetical protein
MTQPVVSLEDFNIAVRDFCLEVDTLDSRGLDVAFSAVSSLYLKLDPTPLNLILGPSALVFASRRYNERLYQLA